MSVTEQSREGPAMGGGGGGGGGCISRLEQVMAKVT